MLRDPLKYLVFSARAMLITWSSQMFCFQYFSFVQDEPGLYNRIKNPQIGTSSNGLQLLIMKVVFVDFTLNNLLK